MLIITHIIVALASLTFSLWLLAKPHQSLVKLNYGLIAATLISGSALVLVHPVGILHTCLVGLVYVGLAVGMTLVGKQRLATATSIN